MEVKALNLNCIYHLEIMAYDFVLNCSIDDMAKFAIIVPVSDEQINHVWTHSDSKGAVVHHLLKGFDKHLKSNGIEQDARTFILDWVVDRLNKKYGGNSWNTGFGQHNPIGFATGGPAYIDSPKINGKPINRLAGDLPGVTTIVKYPCDCHETAGAELFSVIVHLNDYAGWSREKIADWIDKLHDDGIINAEFEPWDETGLAEEEKQFADINVELIGNATKATQAFAKSAEKIKEAFEKTKEKE